LTTAIERIIMRHEYMKFKERSHESRINR